MPGQAFVTVATNDQYAIGGVVLAESLHRTETNRDLVILITNDVSPYIRQLLSDVYDHVYYTTELCSHDDVTLSLMGRPELGITFTKLHCWRLTQYNKCVFLDADTMVLQNCDELFEREELSAVPDTGWPDCFNSGVFVFRPSLETHTRLIGLATSHGSFDGGDQGILNAYFGNWRNDMSKRLPFVYNVVSSRSYSYAPAYKHYSSGVKIVHFLGSEKPWSVQWMTESGNVQIYHRHPCDMNVPVIQMWMGLFREKVLPKLPTVAREKVASQSTTSVHELLQEVRDAETRKYETSQQWQESDHLVQQYFPTQAHRRQSHSPDPPPSHCNTEVLHYAAFPAPSPSHCNTQVSPYDAFPAPPPPPSSHCNTQVSHYDAFPAPPPSSHCNTQVSHYDAFPAPPPSHCDPPRSESHYSLPPQLIQPEEHHDQQPHYENTSNQWEAPCFQSNDGQSNTYCTPTTEEPADPHWEALLWHTVQSPWEPPSPPSLDLYAATSHDTSEQQRQDICEPTFRWFSSDAEARTPPNEWSDTESSKLQESQSSVTTPSRDETTQRDEHRDEAELSEDEVSTQKSETQEESLSRMKSWEEGNIDYLGKDRFDNIWKRLEYLYNPVDSDTEESEEEDLDEIRDTASEMPDSTSSASQLDGDTPVPSVVSEEGNVESFKDCVSVEESFLAYPVGDYSGMMEWQEGRIDYEGRDKSDNIMKRLDLIFSGKLIITS